MKLRLAIFSAMLLGPLVALPAAEDPAPLAQRLAEVAPRFTEPSDDPAWVMPVGTGDFSAMLRYGNDLEIHLSKTDFFGFDKSNYHKNPTLLSPGHVRLSFGIPREAIRSFKQRLDYQRGSVVFEIVTDDGTVNAEAFGIMGGNTLVIDVSDARKVPAATATYSIWRPETSVTAEAGRIVAREVHDYQWNFRPPPNPEKVAPSDQMFHLGCGTVIAFADAGPATFAAGALTLQKPGIHYRLLISAACTYDGKPEAAASKLLDWALGTDRSALLQEHLDWWARFWQASFVNLRGPDADLLMRLWYSGCYSYASVCSGPVLAKFNGGPGLIEKDNRSWGVGLWWQNTREMIWPMCAANRAGYARALLDFYDREFMYWKKATADKGKLGLRMYEWSGPGKPAQAAQPKTVSTFDPAALETAMANRTMEDVKSGYNARSLAQAAELTQLMFDYAAFTGDSNYLKEIVAPWLKEAALFYLSYLRMGDDGLYHSMVSDAAEHWWKVKDPAIDLSAARYLFWQVLNHGAAFGYEPAFLAAVRERAGKLPPLPVGQWNKKSDTPPGQTKAVASLVLDTHANLYAPFADVYDDQTSHNTENPELYIIYPFNMVDGGSPKAERERAVNTFLKRRCPNHAGWSQCPVQAARLRLADAVDVIVDHAMRHAKYPYGGWNSPAKKLNGSATGATDTPYFDAMGVNLTALQETLLQSHRPTTPENADPLGGGPIQLVPAARRDWSGSFKLLARGGFLVTAEFVTGPMPVRAAIECQRGGLLRLANPFGPCRVQRPGQPAATTEETLIAFDTKPGETVEFVWGRPL